MRYVAGFNKPGYLPEMEPREFDDFMEARDWIAEQAQEAADDHGDLGEDELADEMEDFSAEVENLPGDQDSFSLLAPDGYAYWVMVGQ